MSIQYAILGFLSEQAMTGYDLKKRFADSDLLYWSGNNNQIYRALVALHEEGLVTQEVHYQESRPSRKVYSLTAQGREALKAWLSAIPELPQLRHPLLIQLAWAGQLEAGQLEALLDGYAEEVRVKVLMLREQAQRQPDRAERAPREAALRDMIAARWLEFHEQELEWIRRLRQALTGAPEQE